MITIIHGDDAAASRNIFVTEKAKKPAGVSLDGEKMTLTDLVQIFDGSSLFNDNNIVFIESFFSKRKESKEQKEIISFLNAKQATNDIYFWDAKELGKKATNAFPKAKVLLSSVPKSLFTFLDALAPNSGNMLLSLFHETLKTSEAELVFFMLQRQFRILLSLSGPNPRIDEATRMAPWQKTKLQKQAARFSQKKLVHIYKTLFTIDLGQKTGTGNLSLTQAIDFLLINL